MGHGVSAAIPCHQPPASWKVRLSGEGADVCPLEPFDDRILQSRVQHECAFAKPNRRLLACVFFARLSRSNHTTPHSTRRHHATNNNNTIQSGEAPLNRRGASTPLWGVESCSHPSRRPNPIPAIPPYVVRTPHLHGAPTTEESTVKV